MRKLVVAVLAAAIALLLSWLGLSVPQDTIEEAIDENVPQFKVEDEQASIVTDATVTAVVDGDTLIAQSGTNEFTVRVLGIDTPEVAGSPRGAECYGEEASSRAQAILLNEVVRLTSDDTQDLYDAYGRLLAYVETSAGDYGEQMIREGYAEEFTYRVPYRNQAAYRIAEQESRQNKEGLWGVCR